MVIYIVKTLLCAAVLFLIYFFLLEKEKMHRFNRFYLLFSIVFSLTVSFITIETPTKIVTVNEFIAPVYLPDIISTGTDLQQTPTPVPVEKSFPWPNLLLGLYIAGTTFFLIRFTRNLLTLLFKAANNKSIEYHGATLVLENNLPVPHSFLNYIFIDKDKFEQGTIEKEILQHELTHVKQKHSIDILLVELIIVFAWINPLLFLFRKAIMLNHEYLADDAVVNTFNNTESYRLLLFNTVSQSNNLVLSSPFNYLTTKKRLIMMTKNTSRKVAILKQIALIPLIATIGFLLSTRAIAQDNPKQQIPEFTIKKSPPHILPAGSSKTDAPQSVVNEFQAIIAKYKIDTMAMRTHKLGPKSSMEEIKEYGRLTHIDTLKIRKPDRERLQDLFIQMSYKQQNHQFVHFYAKPTLQTKIVPTKTQFESWKDAKIYGVWINGKRVKNAVLNSRSNTDFNYYALRQPDNKASKLMKYQIEVGLTTKEVFDKTQKATLEDLKRNPNKYDMVFVMHSKKALADIDAGR